MLPLLPFPRAHSTAPPAAAVSHARAAVSPVAGVVQEPGAPGVPQPGTGRRGGPSPHGGQALPPCKSTPCSIDSFFSQGMPSSMLPGLSSGPTSGNCASDGAAPALDDHIDIVSMQRAASPRVELAFGADEVALHALADQDSVLQGLPAMADELQSAQRWEEMTLLGRQQQEVRQLQDAQRAEQAEHERRLQRAQAMQQTQHAQQTRAMQRQQQHRQQRAQHRHAGSPLRSTAAMDRGQVAPQQQYAWAMWQQAALQQGGPPAPATSQSTTACAPGLQSRAPWLRAPAFASSEHGGSNYGAPTPASAQAAMMTATSEKPAPPKDVLQRVHANAHIGKAALPSAMPLAVHSASTPASLGPSPPAPSPLGWHWQSVAAPLPLPFCCSEPVPASHFAPLLPGTRTAIGTQVDRASHSQMPHCPSEPPQVCQLTLLPGCPGRHVFGGKGMHAWSTSAAALHGLGDVAGHPQKLCVTL